MIRRAAAVVFALTIQPAILHAQDTVLTITVPSAEVHNGPTTVTPVIGHVARGTVLPIARNLGSWVRIAWPDAADGVGYVHVTMGTIGARSGATAPAPTAASMAATSMPAPPPLPAPKVAPASVAPPRHVSVRDQQGTERLAHLFAVGGLVGSTRSVGASARAWYDSRLGVQVAVSHDALTSDVAPGRVAVTQIEPAIVYALFDRVSDQLWIRPYVGSGVSVRHQALDAVSDTGMGWRVFAGSELTLAAAPQFALSADVGYRHVPTPIPGFDASAVGVSVAAHWYFR